MLEAPEWQSIAARSEILCMFPIMSLYQNLCSTLFWRHAVQANTKWYEGALNQSIYWAVSDDAGLTWGPTRVLIPSPDSLPLWGPVQYSAVRCFVHLPCDLPSPSAA